MTEEQKQFCLKTAQSMNRIKEFPDGAAFLVDLFREVISASGLTIVDAGDPKIGLRREITQELYDVLWTARALRKSGFAMGTAGTLGLASLYADHGAAGLVRYLDVATDIALHNAGLELRAYPDPQR